MRQRKGNLTLYIIVILIAAFVAFNSRTTTFCIGCPGWTTLSLDQVDFVSSDQDIGKAWLLTVVQDGTGEGAVGTFAANEIVDNIDGEQAVYDLSITAQITKNSCRYLIDYQDRALYNINSETIQARGGAPLGFIELCAAKDLADAEASLVQHDCGILGTTFGSCSFTCFWFEEEAKYASIGTATNVFESKLEAAVNNEIVTGIISNVGARSVWLGNRVKAQWVGNLVTGEQCPIPSSQDVVAIYRNGLWKVTDANDYDDLNSYMAGGFGDCMFRLNQFGSDSETPGSCKEEYAAYLDNALQTKDFVSVGGNKALTIGNVDAGQVDLALLKTIQYPVITMKVDANWLGIYVPVGKPKIVQLSSQDFRTGETGYIVAEFDNIGDDDATFSIEVSCTQGFSLVGTALTSYVEAGGSSIANIPIAADADVSNNRGTCTVTVRDIQDPSIKDTGTVNVNAKALLLCASGVERCNGKVVEECNSVGTGWDSSYTCSYACIDDGLTVECEEPPLEECEDVPFWDFGRKIDCYLKQQVYGELGKFVFVIILFVALYLAVDIYSGGKLPGGI